MFVNASIFSTIKDILYRNLRSIYRAAKHDNIIPWRYNIILSTGKICLAITCYQPKSHVKYTVRDWFPAIISLAEQIHLSSSIFLWRFSYEGCLSSKGTNWAKNEQIKEETRNKNSKVKEWKCKLDNDILATVEWQTQTPTKTIMHKTRDAFIMMILLIISEIKINISSLNV